MAFKGYKSFRVPGGQDHRVSDSAATPQRSLFEQPAPRVSPTAFRPFEKALIETDLTTLTLAQRVEELARQTLKELRACQLLGKDEAEQVLKSFELQQGKNGQAQGVLDIAFPPSSEEKVRIEYALQALNSHRLYFWAFADKLAVPMDFYSKNPSLRTALRALRAPILDMGPNRQSATIGLCNPKHQEAVKLAFKEEEMEMILLFCLIPRSQWAGIAALHFPSEH